MAPSWKTFCAGVLGTVLAGFALGLFDAVRVAATVLESGTPEHALTGGAAALALLLAASLGVGVWVGLALVGLAEARPFPALVAQSWRALRVQDRAAETARLARLLAWGLGGTVWMAGALLLFRAATTRIVRPGLAALFTCSALLVWALVVGALVPALRAGLAGLLALRERVRARQLGLVSLPGALAALLVGLLALGWTLRGAAEEFLYALDLTPFLYAAAFLALVPVFLALLATRAGGALLDVASHKLVLLSWSVVVLATPGLAVHQLAEDMAAREAVFEKSVAAAALFSALHPDREPVSVAVVDGGSSASTDVAEEEPPPPPAAPVDPQAPRPPDILVVSVETIRADHVGAYGYTRHATTPNLDAWAATGTRFARAYSSGPCSSSSFTGMMSSQLPSRIGGITRDGDVFTLPRHLVPLASQLRAAGYRTKALMPVINNYLKGVERGFDEYDRSFHYAEAQADRTVAALKDHPADRPLFLWVHFVDPHFPYDPHAAFSSFGRGAEDLYDQEIAFVDHHLGRVFQFLRESGALEHTVVVFLADHGEAFGEHGTRLHGNTLHDEEIHVPLVLVGPGVQAQVVGAPVSLLDLGPTLLDLAQASWRGGKRLGDSLASVLQHGEPAPARRVLAEGCKPGTMLALIDDRKLFYRKNGSRYFLYDLMHDPLERSNLFTSAADAGEWVALVRREMNLLQ